MRIRTSRMEPSGPSRLRVVALLCVGLSLATQPATKAGASNQSARGSSSRIASELSKQEQKVIRYLQDDWGKDYSVTSVDLAMRAVGLPPSDESRFRIGSYIKNHPELHEVIRRWGWETLVLTPNEKLIARAVINAARDKRNSPSLSEMAAAAAISADEAKRALVMLERHAILKRDRSAGGAEYAVAAPRYLNWEPRLDFLFHQVTLASGRRFNTN